MRPRPKMVGAKTAMTIHDFSAQLGTGDEHRFTDYRGKVLLIVNVASKCGFTSASNSGPISVCGVQRHSIYGPHRDRTGDGGPWLFIPGASNRLRGFAWGVAKRQSNKLAP